MSKIDYSFLLQKVHTMHHSLVYCDEEEYCILDFIYLKCTLQTITGILLVLPKSTILSIVRVQVLPAKCKG